MNCHLAITRVKFVYLIDACVLRRKLNRRFHNKRRKRVLGCDTTSRIFRINKAVAFTKLKSEEAFGKYADVFLCPTSNQQHIIEGGENCHF